MIDGIDKSLPLNPRNEYDLSGNVTKTYKRWQTLGLGAKWDTYMDRVFDKAKDKGTKFMNDNLQRLKDEYTSQAAKDKAVDDPTKIPAERQEIADWAKLREEVEGYITNLDKAWEDAKDWKKPW